jgi:type IV pilus assembly protein PilB
MALDAPLGRKLSNINREAEERDAKRRAATLGYAYLSLTGIPLEVDALALVPEVEARKGRFAIIGKNRQKLTVVAYDPSDAETQKSFKALDAKHYTLEISVCSLSGLQNLWNFFEFVHKDTTDITGKIALTDEMLTRLREQVRTLAKAQKALAEAADQGLEAHEFLELFLATALTLRASDIHLEAGETTGKFRVRIDGILHDVTGVIKNEDYFFVISRIKLLSGLKLNIRNQAQDGRFTISVDKKEVEIRVSVLPSEFGETVVLRILDPDTIKLELKDLGLRKDDLVLVEAELKRPNGMILNTGPTGSGKTTTLYAFLLHVNSPDIKIITIENPIEYRLEGIEQTQVDDEAGYTFENGLRAIVRQDPDMILVGEIRDYETAEIAMHAALTGHLVFSTLHTNDSFGSIPRLVDLGAKPTIIGPALSLVIAQRLVRRLCEHCKVPAEVTPKIKEEIKSFFGNLATRVDRNDYPDIKLYKAVGCEECGTIGYKGRIAIFEFLPITDKIRDLIHKDTSEVEIKAETKRTHDIVTMQEDGILKIIQGITTFEEVEDNTGPIGWQKEPAGGV